MCPQFFLSIYICFYFLNYIEVLKMSRFLVQNISAMSHSSPSLYGWGWGREVGWGCVGRWSRGAMCNPTMQ